MSEMKLGGNKFMPMFSVPLLTFRCSLPSSAQAISWSSSYSWSCSLLPSEPTIHSAHLHFPDTIPHLTIFLYRLDVVPLSLPLLSAMRSPRSLLVMEAEATMLGTEVRFPNVFVNIYGTNALETPLQASSGLRPWVSQPRCSLASASLSHSPSTSLRFPTILSTPSRSPPW